MMTNIVTADRFLTVRCKAFSNEGVRRKSIHVEADIVTGATVKRGAIRVWDDVAGYFTSCHALSEATQRRLRRTVQ